jgi:hypothetical protein
MRIRNKLSCVPDKPPKDAKGVTLHPELPFYNEYRWLMENLKDKDIRKYLTKRWQDEVHALYEDAQRAI